MALWGLTDTANSAPKWLNASDPNTSNDLDNAYFIDTTEAAVAENRAQGLKTPGWNLYTTYTTNGGTVTRHRAESLVVAKVSAANAGDLGVTGDTADEDNVVADS